jgi:hypothetical protein
MITKRLLLMLLLFSMCSVGFSQPAAPTGLTASIEKWNGLKYILLKWDESSTNSDRYFVYKKEGGLNDPGAFLKLPFPIHNHSYKDKLVMWDKTYSYYVTAYYKGLESQSSDSIEITISDTLTPAQISGTLTDEVTGLNLRIGKVELIPLLGWHLRLLPVDTNGNYSTFIRPGKYFLYFLSPGYLPEFYDNAGSIFSATQVELNENTSTVINAALIPVNIHPQYTLSGKVTDTSGNPVKALLSVIVLNRCWFRHHLFHGVTDSMGHYSVPVRGGDSVVVYTVSPNKDYLPEFYNDKREFVEADRIFINGNITDIDFVLDTKPVYNNSLSGKITDQDGNSVMASVTLFKLRDHRHPKFKRTMITDSLGNYSFSNIHPGTYVLFTLPEYGYLPTFFRYDGQQTVKWREADSIEVTENSFIENINVKVLPVPDSGYGTVRGTITDNSGAGINGAMVYMVNENTNVSAFASTDENGNYEISNLAPGSYTIVSDKFEYEDAELSDVTIDYSSNQVQSVSLVLNPLSATSVDETDITVSDYRLYQNYPNPFNPITIVNYQIPVTGFVSLKVFNLIGQEVANLVSEVKIAGRYQVKFDASKLNSGIYFYTLKAGNINVTNKMVLLK